jgi:hypothetical protein
VARQLIGKDRRVFFYALGGGRGHVTRIGALACALEARGAATLAGIPAERQRVAGAMGVPRWLSIEAAPPAALRARLARAVQDFDATDWVVDTFPEGILGELAEPIAVGIRRVALLRLRRDAESPHFVDAMRHYDRCLDLEPHLEWLRHDGRVQPFAAVTRELGDASPEPVESLDPEVLLVGAETSHRVFLARLGHRLSLAGVRVHCPPDPVDRPLDARALGAVVVVGPAGYNLTYELVRTGAWHVALPATRRYDDQLRRAERVATVCSSPEAVERRVLGLLAHAGRRPLPCPVLPMENLADALLDRV